MKKIIEFLEENNIEYRAERFGNPDYFGDGFSVSGLVVSFDFFIDDDAPGKMARFERFMKLKRSYVLKGFQYGAGYTYRIFKAFDARRLEEHEKAVSEAVEAFWQAEHARRMQATA